MPHLDTTRARVAVTSADGKRIASRCAITTLDLPLAEASRLVSQCAHLPDAHPGDALAHLTDVADVYRGDDTGLLRWLKAEIAALEAQTGEKR